MKSNISLGKSLCSICWVSLRSTPTYFGIVLFLFCFSLHALSWSDLWRTSDQQGQEFMDKRQFTEAKEHFVRPDWAGAAAYRAGDYKGAAQLFKELHDEQGYYNLGNSLAHLGQYKKAIEAYNKTLALNPKHQDALFNRKLLEELLKQNKDQQNKDQQDKDQQDKDQQDKDQQDKDQQGKDQQDKDQQDKDQQDKKDKEQQDKQSKEQQNKDKQDKDKQDKEEAKQKIQAQEKQQAKEQWLRLIPDDPGGLMREKFLRDHLRREHGWYDE